ncbi:type IX secretion system outer membrane channel protein PorV [Aequorivita lipolytica]|uniref:Type IX secretion system outer membrane channel protein PorV n=1 Tax=Aequorivita lipolytica TaxID=153267 RepID=A0A5C6YQY0_9FLAO|nr:type IX secretion system outer membrane channel protein PorV [Aequorivita lipolytica]TXD69952.1 type IX secretion system outer membrane channel protein PorV [Aequorivita lipolytica]SRX50224.1 hypothetical protein AEQU2_00695 [Aequorivita lipolytica]
MKKLFIPVLVCLVAFQAHSQETIIVPNGGDSRVITTGVPFVLIAADPRAGGMGDIGVVTSADAFSQQWNPAKYAFALSKQGVGVTYTPYLSKLVNDIFLGNLTYYNRLNERSALGVSFRYFKLGEIEARETAEQLPLILSPNELTFDVSYSLRLSERFAMAVAGRYLRSDLKLQIAQEDASAAGSFAVDIAGYYQSEEIPYNDFDGRWRMGFNISNIGPTLKYDEAGSESFLPTKLALGGGFDFILDEYNKVGVSAEVNKLLVPTPPIRGTEFVDDNGNGVQDPGEEVIDNRAIFEGKDNNVTFVKGMFQSFGDAPGGFSEELREFTWALGAEYWYQDVFAFRAGYFNESDDKGGRKFASFGAGFRYTTINIDISYLFGLGTVVTPVDGTLRFGLTFNFGDTYDEY